jgi:hypothetical protein
VILVEEGTYVTNLHRAWQPSYADGTRGTERQGTGFDVSQLDPYHS